MQTGSSAEAIADVREGMRVVDSAGEIVGKVKLVQMGDPEAVTTEGNQGRPDDLAELVVEAVVPDQVEPDVPDPLRTRLRRTGYLKIDGHGLLATDRYVSSEQIQEVAEDVVRLNVHKRDLVAKG